MFFHSCPLKILYLLYKLILVLNSVTVNTGDQRWRTKQSETSKQIFVVKITYYIYVQVRTRIPVSLDLSVTIGPRDIPHRRGSGSGTGSLAPQSRGPVPDSETVPVLSIITFAYSSILSCFKQQTFTL